MARYLVTYHGSEMPHDPESMARARDAFIAWSAKVGAPLVDPGAPIIGMRTISSSGPGSGPADGPANGWSVVDADDADGVAEILRDHPFLSRGGVLQINEPAPA